MIPRDYITEWRTHAPWVENSQVEQDLVISRAPVSIFTHPLLGKALAFRGGTALSQGNADPSRIVAAFDRYMKAGGHHVTRAVFEENLAAKLDDKRFTSDVPPLLTADQDWNVAKAAALIMDMLCPLLQGDPWKRDM